MVLIRHENYLFIYHVALEILETPRLTALQIITIFDPFLDSKIITQR